MKGTGIPLYPAYWRDVVGYEGKYLVSFDGRVCTRHDAGGSWRDLKPCLTTDGYMVVSCCGKLCRVHRLVLEAFTGPQPAGHEGSHINGIKTDNRIENLLWETPLANQRRNITNGVIAWGERLGSAKLTAENVRAIRECMCAGEADRSIARRYGVGPTVIHRIRRGTAWVRVPGRTGGPIIHSIKSPVRDAAKRDLPPCPYCGVLRGDPCRTPSTQTRRPHLEREMLLRVPPRVAALEARR